MLRCNALALASMIGLVIHCVAEKGTLICPLQHQKEQTGQQSGTQVPEHDACEASVRLAIKCQWKNKHWSQLADSTETASCCMHSLGLYFFFACPRVRGSDACKPSYHKSRENGSAQTGARTREQLQESEEAVSVRGIGWHLFSVLSVNGTVQTK